MTEKAADTMSVHEAAKRLGVDVKTVYAAIQEGRFPFLRFTKRRILIPRAAFERMLAGEWKPDQAAS